MSPRSLVFLALASTLVPAAHAVAQPLVAPPGDPTFDAPLAGHVSDLSRIQDSILSVPLGFGLEAAVVDAGHRTLIESFVSSGMPDFQAATGMHPYAVLDSYEEQGDLGMFGGVQAAGLAWRYQALRDHGGTPAEIDAARAALVRAIEGLHWITAVTGTPGGVVRGIMRIAPEHPSDPPIPGGPITTTPLHDAMGHPQPAMKEPTWRDDASGTLPFLAWLDDCSKDQLDGYVIAIGAAYDAIVGDPMVDPALVDRLRADATAIGQRLMVPRDVGGGHMADLVIFDADGRPTSFHDLSAEEITPGVVSTRPINGFNAVMALGIMRTLYHVSGDPEIGHFYYQSLIGDRDYLTSAMSTVRLMYQGTSTNYSNVNMAFVAIFGVLRYETDPTIQARIRDVLETQIYAPGLDREARHLGLPFFDFVYAGFRSGGAMDTAGGTAVMEGLATLDGYPTAPIWDPAIVNCDAMEIAAGSCVGIDGTTHITIAMGASHGGGQVAVDPVPIAIRPHSDFEHRSDPHRFNGGGSPILGPGGDIVAAYWLGRLLDRTGGTSNVSSHARDPLPWTPASMRDAGTSPDAGASDAGSAVDAGSAPPASGGCGCRVGTRDPRGGALAVVLGLALSARVAMKRRRVAASNRS
jgi:hypothetical protein